MRGERSGSETGLVESLLFLNFLWKNGMARRGRWNVAFAGAPQDGIEHCRIGPVGLGEIEARRFLRAGRAGGIHLVESAISQVPSVCRKRRLIARAGE